MFERVMWSCFVREWLLGFLLFGFLCVSCRTTQGVPIVRGVRMPLLAPQLLGRKLSATQRFSSIFRGKRRTFYVQLEVDASRVVMVGLTPIGAKLFELSYTKGKLQYVPQPFFRAKFQPAHILADFQLTFWPLAVLKRTLGAMGLEVKEVQAKGQKLRLFLRKGRPVIRIRYEDPQDAWKKRLYFNHLERRYQFVIETAQVRPLEP